MSQRSITSFFGGSKPKKEDSSVQQPKESLNESLNESNESLKQPKESLKGRQTAVKKDKPVMQMEHKSPKKRVAVQVDARHKGSVPKSAKEQEFAREIDENAMKKAKIVSPEAEAAKKAQKAASYRAFLANKTLQPPHLGEKEVPKGAKNCLFGFTFLITGVQDSMLREDMETLIKEYNGKVAKSVTKGLTHAIVGIEPGIKKMEKLQQRPDVKQIDEDGLFDLIRSVKLSDQEQRKIQAAEEKKVAKKERDLAAETKRLAVELAKTQEATPATPAAASAVQGRAKMVTSDGVLWVDKFRPRTAKDLVGNPGNIAKLGEFLEKWSPESSKKAVLLSGPPGIGKTSAAHVMARSKGYRPVEFNASDTRNKKAVLTTLGDMVVSRGVGEYFGAGGTLNGGARPGQGERVCVIMDEVDGMSGGDRGGTQALILMIKKTKVPIICICNDRQSTKVRSLRNYCLELPFRRPTEAQVSQRLRAIAGAQKLAGVTDATLTRLYESCQGDFRQVLTMLQMWTDGTTLQLEAGAAMDEKLESTGKEISLGPFDAIKQVFAPREPKNAVNDLMTLFWSDRDLMPLFVFENYPNVAANLVKGSSQRQARRSLPPKLRGNNLCAHLELVARAADALSVADTIERTLRREQAWSLAQAFGALAVAAPGILCRGTRPESLGRVEFPSYLGNFSKARKATRLTGELHARMRASVSANADDVALEYAPVLRGPLTQPMLNQGKDGIPEVIALMDEYGLLREDWDSMCELRLSFVKDPRADIPSTVKSAFTRTYNKQSHAVRAVGATGTKKAGPTSRMLGEDEAAEEEFADDEDDEDDESDLKDDLLIKEKKAKPKRKAGEKAPPKKKAKKE